jgi:hypothetical protein
VLRIVEFAEMTKPNVRLLRIVLCDILMLKDEQEVMQIFQVTDVLQHHQVPAPHVSSFPICFFI